MQELIPLIEDWSRERDIDKCDPLLQTTKTLEEIIELQQAIIRYENLKSHPFSNRAVGKNYEMTEMNKYLIDIKDLIGDIFITLVMLSMQNDIEIVDYVLTEIDNLSCAKVNSGFLESVFLLKNFAKLQGNIKVKSEKVTYYINYAITQLILIANCYNLTLKECVEHAYDEIKDRKGKIVDGLFVKECE